MKPYKSPHEAYPFLSDAPEDLRCDFEILTDEASSSVGLLCSLVQGNAALHSELQTINELMYHANPTLRTRLTLTPQEVDWLAGCTKRLQSQLATPPKQFYLPQGGQKACLAHILRVKGKQLVRLLYRHAWQGHAVPPLLLDFMNIFSGYFFALALWFNQQENIAEVPFTSRNYT